METITQKEIAISLRVNNTTVGLALARVPRVAQEANAYLYDRDTAREAVIRYFEDLHEKHQRKAERYAEMIEKARKL